MAKRKTANTNTINPGPVTLDDEQLATLDRLVKSWNAANPNDPPTWDVLTALAALAVQGLNAAAPDHGEEPRRPTYATPTTAPHAVAPPLDSVPDVS